jgi:hypothetical protein
MREEPARTNGRPWQWVVTALAAIFLVIVVLFSAWQHFELLRPAPVEGVSGDHSGVVGLPVPLFMTLLEKAGRPYRFG